MRRRLLHPDEEAHASGRSAARRRADRSGGCARSKAGSVYRQRSAAGSTAAVPTVWPCWRRRACWPMPPPPASRRSCPRMTASSWRFGISSRCRGCEEGRRRGERRSASPVAWRSRGRERSEERELAEAKLRVEELGELINHHSYRYHVLDDPEVADIEYDEMVCELQALEDRLPGAHHPRLADPAGGQRVRPTCSHPSHTGRPCSRWTTRSRSKSWRAWNARVEKRRGRCRSGSACELKIDGVACALTYERGRAGARRDAR